MQVTALILAAGKGTRMESDTTKMLHEVSGKPMLAHVMDSCLKAGVSDIVLIAGSNIGALRAFARTYYPSRHIRIVLQKQQLGTADAVRAVHDGENKAEPRHHYTERRRATR